MSTTYRVRIDTPHVPHATTSCGPAYVRDRPDWDASWYTREPARAKTWKTRRGAQRWLDERPEVSGAVETL